ncbi:hypothetical protein LS70_005355 [Helicobacter sp. MIT 11-5569]|uniref:hypothetical protein n=1 Tax=Helicobacter sp. MIT 11-5569 TaxID=1548151 RepID=UPI00051FCD2D|nr:hypothetical protein [Helicobacter sp. MIT 11-5569]TLD83178.1 hypothetical protein LS70_005355 [Helicobacter sp. MIT 11-5569]
MQKSSYRKNCILLFSTLGLFLNGCDEQSLNDLENKAGQTFQNALQDSGLKDTLESHAQKLNDFLESNKTKEFIEKQTEIIKDGANELGKIVESNKTKEILQKQMENLNEILEGKQNTNQPANVESI